MPRPNEAEAARLKERITSLVDQGMSISQIGRVTGKSSQAVHDYLRRHDLETVEMRRRRKTNLDKENTEGENGATEKRVI